MYITYLFHSLIYPVMGFGVGSSSSLLMSLELSTPDDQWGWGPPPHWSCHFNSQLLMMYGVAGVGPLHCSCHFNSQLLMTNGCGTLKFRKKLTKFQIYHLLLYSCSKILVYMLNCNSTINNNNNMLLQ